MSWTYKVKYDSDECADSYNDTYVIVVTIVGTTQHPMGYCELCSKRGHIVMCIFENCPYEEKEEDRLMW